MIQHSSHSLLSWLSGHCALEEWSKTALIYLFALPSFLGVLVMDQDHITAKHLALHVCYDLGATGHGGIQEAYMGSSAGGLQRQRLLAIVLSVQGLDSLGMHGE